MAWESVIYEKFDKVARVTMNRPEVRNAQDTQLLTEVLEAFEAAEVDPEVRVVILTGAGPTFSSGHDLGSPRARAYREAHPRSPGQADGMKYEEDMFLRWCLRVHDFDKPNIAQVQGWAIIGGWMLAGACDLLVCSEDAKFADTAVRWAAPCGEFNRYVYDLGARKAMELVLTGDTLTAQEAYRLGMVTKVVPKEKLEEETMALAQRIATNHPFLLKLAKRTINETLDSMGFRDSLWKALYMHELAHAHFQSAGPVVPREEGERAIEWAKKRDQAFGDQNRGY